MIKKPVKTESVGFDHAFTVQIMGKTYQVKPLSDNTRNEQFGTASYSEQLIQYNTTLALDEKKDTIIHEMIHCLDHNMQTDLTEKQIHAISSGAYSILRDNKDFFKWVLSHD